MGHTTALGIAESGISLDQQLAWHLTGNHYPPVPTSMVQPCIEAIQAINAGDYDKAIALPDGVGYKGRTDAPARAIAEAHHLDAFLDYYGEDN
jgi:hypothetical protein